MTGELVVPEPAKAPDTVTVTELSAYEVRDLIAQVQCPVVADDGAQCQRFVHPDTPNSHDFVVPQGVPVDGGQHWSHWITTVHAVRDAILDQTEPITNDRGEVIGQRRFALLENYASDEAGTLCEIAELVGLHVELGDAGQRTRQTRIVER